MHTHWMSLYTSFRKPMWNTGDSSCGDGGGRVGGGVGV
jgi:hypothetical protein